MGDPSRDMTMKLETYFCEEAFMRKPGNSAPDRRSLAAEALGRGETLALWGRPVWLGVRTSGESGTRWSSTMQTGARLPRTFVHMGQNLGSVLGAMQCR